MVLRLVSHNAYWFQGVPFAGDQPGPAHPEILSGLAQLYTELAPDVLCLQEIQSRATAGALAAILGLDFMYAAGGAYPQYGAAVFSRWEMIASPVPAHAPLDRVILRVRIYPPGRPPLLLSNVHLPSGRQRGPEGGQAQCLAELPVAVTPDAGTGEVDVALGDFNEPPDGPCAAMLASHGYVDAARSLKQGHVFSNVKGSIRGDQIWLAPHVASGLRRYCIAGRERLAVNWPGKTYLSDHLPVGVELQ